MRVFIIFSYITLLWCGCFIFSIVSHPLDPLSASEIEATTVIIKKYNNSASWVFNRISLQEPEKALMLPSYLANESPPANIPRRSFVVLIDSITLIKVEAVVNLNTQQVESWTNLPGTLQPGLNRFGFELPKEIAKNDSRVKKRCSDLGWSRMSLVAADVWPISYIGDRPDLHPENRLVQVFFHGKMFENDNEYAHPFDFVAIVDLKQRKVVSIEDLPSRDNCPARNSSSSCSKPNTVPRRLANYDPDVRGGSLFLRKGLKPVNITQPGGHSFSVTDNGYLFRWQKFQFRLGYNEREGIVIHQVGFHDNDVGKSKTSQWRPLFYRLSMAEAYVVYGDPRPPYQRKSAFDIGEIDMGILAPNKLDKRYCNGQNVHYFDAYISGPYGEAKSVPRAICIYEEDVGLAWKHTDYRTGKATVVRNQRLNVGFMTTAGNYDYIYKWRFYQDASIQFEVRMTGIVNTVLAAKGSTPVGHGSIVSPQVNAQYHQHVFAMRLDSEVDGNKNTVVNSDVVPERGSRYGQAIVTNLTEFNDALQARSYAATSKSRSWLIRSTNDTKNPYTNSPTAYKLTPLNCPRFIVPKDSPVYPKAAFAEYDLWVTPYKDGQLYPGDRYLNNSGLPVWSKEASDAGTSIKETDVVVWHVFRMDHIPRAEDFPVMPTEVVGFTLKPYNFFTQNPALDVVPEKAT